MKINLSPFNYYDLNLKICFEFRICNLEFKNLWLVN